MGKDTKDLMVIGDEVKMELTRTNVIMPKDYSFENALKSAHLVLQQTVDRNKRPALEVCSKESIHQAILYMAIQGLNPAKVQCYFTVYGTKLVCMVSQYGDVAVAMRVNPDIKDIRAACIYKGDEIEIAIEAGMKVIKKHSQTFESLNSGEIIGCYAIIIDHNDKVIDCDIMTMEQIKMSWRQSNRKDVVMASGNVNMDTTHGKFSEEMVKKTVFHRICKKTIRSSNDSSLLSAYEMTNEETPTETRVQLEISENANKQMIDLPVTPDHEQIKAENALSLAETGENPIMNGKNTDFVIESQKKMCDIKMAKKIGANEKKLGRDKNGFLKNISGMIKRDVKKCSELTMDEAQMYYDMQLMDIQELDNQKNQEQEEPPWA